MAAVTINTQKFTVLGNVRAEFYNITGANGQTLSSNLENVLMVNVQLTATNPPSAVAVTGGGSAASVVTFTAGGTFTTNVELIGT